MRLSQVHGEILKILPTRDTDSIILNNANPIIALEAVRGTKVLIRDEELYIRYMLKVPMKAEDLSNDLLDIYRMRKEVWDYLKKFADSYSKDVEKLVEIVDNFINL